MSTSGESSEILARYRRQLAELAAEVTELQRRDRQYAHARGGVFALAAAAAAAAFFQWGPPWPMWALAATFFASFVTIIGLHEALRDRLSLTVVRQRLKKYQRARYLRRWDKVPVPTVEVPVQMQGLARDLDLFERASVYQWLCRAHTPRGKKILRDWLLFPAEVSEIKRRQEAVRTLVGMPALRDDVELHGRILSASAAGSVGFVQWAESAPRYSERRWLLGTFRALTIVMVLLPALIWWQWVSPDWIVLVLVLVVLHVLLNALYVGGVHDVFNQVSAGQNEMWHYSALLTLVRGLPDDCPKLAELKALLTTRVADFETSLRRLNRIMKWGSGRRSALFGIPYFVAQVLWFWDFHVVTRLERWQQQVGPAVRGWFEAVGTLESLSCLATVAADHPSWAYPRVESDQDELVASGVGHPLLPVDRCQPNDIRVGPPGSFVLVTGSNMSGKSTILRALGVNILLAQCGGPVCAAEFDLPNVELATSMRVTDSLAQGASFFLAELKRLKQIVDRASDLAVTSSTEAPGRRLFFLLDEILQGTNTAERHIAATRILSHLLQQRAFGVVSTHDLELATASELQSNCQTVHFREHFVEHDGRREMRFDYRLRPGIAPTTNALILLELVGLKASTKAT